MSLDPRQQKQIMDLLILSLEGEASPKDMQELREILNSSSEARDYYLKAVIAAECIRKNDWEAKDFENEPVPYEGMSVQMWKALSLEEQTAPNAVIPSAAKDPQEDAKATEIKKPHPQISKFSVYSLLLSSAALIFVVVYAFFISMRRGVEVATLADSMNAQWANAASSLEKGTRMVTGNDRWLLREGYAELLFDNQTHVTLEGPVEFQILAEDRIGLHYGKVYARVPKTAAGFSVYSQNVKIIDLGTEFGVQTEIGGNTHLHVLKGKTMLMAGKTDKVNMEVSQGNAKKISGETGEVSDIGCRSDYFVRTINSKLNCVWKGQNQINLADMVGGGNGFGTGAIDTGFDPLSGKPSSDSPGTRKSDNSYCLVPANSFIDGIFVPNGQTQQIVSSQGHLFRQCPVTSGSTYHNLTNGMRFLDKKTIQDSRAPVSQSAHSILMHANVGITYDLQAIRGLLQGVQIVRFQSKLGIEDVFLRPALSNADFWILVDGELRYQKAQVKVNQLFSVDIELSEKDRFLTLVVTDGKDPQERIIDNAAYPAIDCDWCMFADPVLVLE